MVRKSYVLVCGNSNETWETLQLGVGKLHYNCVWTLVLGVQGNPTFGCVWNPISGCVGKAYMSVCVYAGELYIQVCGKNLTLGVWGNLSCGSGGKPTFGGVWNPIPECVGKVYMCVCICCGTVHTSMWGKPYSGCVGESFMWFLGKAYIWVCGKTLTWVSRETCGSLTLLSSQTQVLWLTAVAQFSVKLDVLWLISGSKQHQQLGTVTPNFVAKVWVKMLVVNTNDGSGWSSPMNLLVLYQSL